jgi:hypothetical protein
VLKTQGMSLKFLPSYFFSLVLLLAIPIFIIYTVTILHIFFPISLFWHPCLYLPDVADLKGRKMTTDNSGLVHHLGYADSLNVAISICLTYTLIFTCVRIHLRRSSFGADDAVVLVATMATMAHFAASYACLTAGLGKPYDMIKGDLDRLNFVG